MFLSLLFHSLYLFCYLLGIAVLLLLVASMSTFQLPLHHNLFIATPDAIHLHSRSEKRILNLEPPRAVKSGLCAAELIPGYESRVVAIGHDAKCRFIDFRDGGHILRTWRVEGTPDCISVLSGAPSNPLSKKEKKAAPDRNGMKTNLIAVGIREGSVFIFDMRGLPVHEINIGASIVALKWVEGTKGSSVLSSGSLTTVDCHLENSKPDEKNASERDENQNTVKEAALPLSCFSNVFRLRPTDLSLLPSQTDTPHGSSKTLSHKPSSENLNALSQSSSNQSRAKSSPKPRTWTETFRIPSSSWAPFHLRRHVNRSVPTSPSEHATKSDSNPDLPLQSLLDALARDGDGCCSVDSLDKALKDREKRHDFEVNDRMGALPPRPHRPTSIVHRKRSISYDRTQPIRRVTFRRSSSLDVPSPEPSPSPISPIVSEPERTPTTALRGDDSPTITGDDTPPNTGDGEAESPNQLPAETDDPGENGTSRVRQRIRRLKHFIKNIKSKDDTEPVEKKSLAGGEEQVTDDSRDSVTMELRALRQEFALLREALLARR